MKKRFYSVLILFCCSVFHLSAQTYNWSASIGGSKTTPIPTADEIRDIATDAAGNVYVVGYYTANMTMPVAPLTATNGGLQDIFLAKYNSAGVMQWYQKAGVAQGDKGLSIAVNSAGEVYMAGSFQGSVFFKFAVGFNLVSNGANPDMVLAKYSAAGVLDWARGVGSTGPDEAVAVALDPAENPYIAGYISSTSVTNVYITGNFPAPNLGTLNGVGGLDVAVIRFTPAGGYTSSNVYGSVAGSEKPTAMKIDASGEMYLAGVFFNTVDFDPIGITNISESAPQGSGDAFIAKYTAAGALAWVGSLRGVASEFVNDLSVDGSGNLIAVGSFTGFENFDLLGGTQTLTSSGLKDIFIAKYDAATGIYISARQIGGAGDDEAYGVHVFSSGDFYVTGSFTGASIDFDPSAGTNNLTSAGTTDAFLAKYTTAIANTTALNIGAAAADVSYAVNYTSDGKIVWAGSYSSAIDVDPGVPVVTLTSLGAEDMFLLSYNESCIAPSITTQPTATQTLCTGNAAAFSVVAAGTSLTYQWKLGATSLTNGGTISGATSANLAISSLVPGDAGNYTCEISGVCGGPVTTNISALTVNSGASITTQPVATQTLCVGAAAGFSVVATGTSLTYQWKKGVTSLTNGGNISGATSANLAISSLVAGDAGNYTCDVTASGCGAAVTTTVSALTVNTAVAITTQPVVSQTLCTGNAASISVVATGTGLTYQWKLGATSLTNGGTISGATSANLAISSLIAGDAGNYTCVISGSCGAPVTSNISVLNINNSISITTQPAATQTLCTGNAAAFSVVASGSGLTYQWKLGATSLTNGGTISGATSANLAISSLVAGDAGNYTCVVSGSCGAPVTSAISALTVNTSIAITTQPVATQTLCAGTAAAFSVVATGSGLMYQWKLGVTSLTNVGTISGATSANLAISSLVAGDAGNYTCVVSGSCGAPLTSSISALTVNTPVAITTQPVVTQTLCTGTAAAMSVVATGSGLTYQWKLGAVSLVNGGAISGATSANLAISSLVAGDAGNYTCVISGSCGSPVTSNVSALIVNTSIAIATQPVATQTLCAGTAAAFSIVATGTGLTYQWKLGAVSLTNAGTISGVTSANLAISSLVAGDAGNYTCVISGTCGAPITSSISALIVNTPVAITTQPVAGQTLCTGNAAAFSVVATGSGLTYQWELGAVSLVNGGTLSGATTANLAISSLVAGDAGNYTCVISGLCGAPVTSGISALTVNTGASITTNPVATQTLCASNAAAFNVVATGSGLTYQWKLGAVSLVDGGTISGANSANLAISSLVAGDAGNYTCSVTASGCGVPVVTSISALIVNTPVVITTQPIATQTLCTGSAAAFSVVATGSGLTYQWKLGAVSLVDGGTLSGATTANLAISSLVVGDASNYTCEISGSCGAPVTSTVSTLIVNTPVAITTQPVATQTLCTGTAAAFSAVVTGSGLTYQWNLAATALVDGGTISGATSANLAISSLVAGDAGNYTCVITGSCGAPVTSSVSALIVNMPIAITTQPLAGQTLCTGNAASFNVVATGSGLSYQWELGAVALVDGGTISGTTTSTLAISSLIAGDAGNYTCVISGSCGAPVTSSISALTVNTGSSITTQPVATQTLCTGTAASFSVVASGSSLTYQWKLGAVALVDGGTISGAMTANLAISSLVAGDAGNYTCDVTASGCGAPTTTSISALTVNSSASITTQPVATQTLCTGNAAAFNVVAAGSGLTYQWYLGAVALVDGGTISGATTANLSIISLVAGDAGNYTCDIADLCGTPVTSAISALTVNTGSSITTQPVATQTLCTGSAAAFSLVATGSGLTYQWNLAATALVDGGTISGATTANLAISSLVAGDAGNYTCVISGSCGAPVTTSISALTVNTPVAITTQPLAGQTLCTGNAAAFNVVAAGSGLTYQWYLGAVALVDGGMISGATTANLSISSLVAGDAGNYTCDIADLCGTPVTSAISALTVNTGSSITTQPVATQTLCTGTAASFSVVAAGSSLTYQWKLGAVALVDGGTISGATTANLAISSLVAGDAGNYTCDVTASGCGAPTTTSISALIVNSSASITTQPVATQTLCTGNAAAFNVVAAGSGLTYQWYLGAVALVDGGTISGATTSTLTISSLVAGDAGNYTCDITDLCGTPVTSTVSALTVNTGSSIITQPVATQTLCAGTAASFNVVAAGSSLTYQWKLGAVALVDGGTISGATTANLAISSLVAGDAGNYTCDVTASGCGAPTTTSISALIVNSSASITTQPVATQTLCTGNAAAFNVVAAGSGLTYQWKLGAIALVDGGTISGATTSTLNISSLVAGDAGNYTCDIADLCGTPVTSAISALTVNTGSSITTQPVATQTLCTGTAAGFSVVAAGSSLTYQWKLGAVALVDGGTISGATTANLAISSSVAGDAGNYTCDVTASGCGAPTTTTVSALIVNSFANITTQPVATQTLCAGSGATISVIASGSGLTYQWKLGGSTLVNGGTIAGATTATLSISSLIAGDAGNYTCVISDLCATPVTSAVSALVVSSGSALITTQPTNIIACAGLPATFDLIASGVGLTYQWKKNGVSLVDGGNVTGATTSSLVLIATTLADAATYTCVIASTCGAPITSSSAVLTVGASTVVVTKQPISSVICLNQQASFSVIATGGISYQWQYKPTGGAYADIANAGSVSGATTAVLVINNAQFINRGNYRCVIGSSACAGGLPSAAASLSFESPMIISEPLSQSLCNNQTVTFGLVALGNNLSYQWMKDGAILSNSTKVSGATTPNLRISNVDVSDAANYYCIVQGLCPPPALSDVVSLFVSFCTDVEEANQTNVFTVYPNPSEGQFNIEMRKFTASNLQYDVFNTLGENVFSSSLEGGGDVTSTIDLGEQASGVYLLRVRYGDQQVWERLVLEK